MTELNWRELAHMHNTKNLEKKSTELNTFPSRLEGNGEYVDGHSRKTFSDAQVTGVAGGKKNRFYIC